MKFLLTFYKYSSRVNRGGSWLYSPSDARVAYRYGDPPGYRGYDLGFRLCGVR